LASLKENCSVFTPSKIVTQMLDLLGYTRDLYGKRILENSCGDGAFLVEVVRRYIHDCRGQGIGNDAIRQGLERDIWGYEIDEGHAAHCVAKLDTVIEEHGIPPVCWNITKGDVLAVAIGVTFRYAVGNPPYITYSALDEDTRSFIKNTFEVCSIGKPDYYYAFVESALRRLDENGRFAYLIPNNFFKTKFAGKLRQFLLPGLIGIYDYTQEKLFDVLTSSAIILCDRAVNAETIQYHDMLTGRAYPIPKSFMQQRWILPVDPKNGNVRGKLRFGDYFSAASTDATLCNEAYLLENPSAQALGESVVRPAVSPRTLTKAKAEYIIFPYAFNGGTLTHYSEEAFTAQFPHAAAHLKKYEEKLSKRKSDKSAKWFEYGRSQALAHMNQRKLLISTLITGKVKVYELDEHTIPYTGIYIVPKSAMPLALAKEILESESFFAYIKQVGIHANGTSMRISISDVTNYLSDYPSTHSKIILAKQGKKGYNGSGKRC